MISYTVTPETMFEFNFSSDVEGEFHAIGLDTDNQISPERIFQLYGSQSWSHQNYNDYPGNGTYRYYRIPLGQYFTGRFDRIVLIAGDEIYKSADSFFSDLRLYEEDGISLTSIETVSNSR